MASGGPVDGQRGYLAWEAGELAGVSGTTIGQWARRGYVRASVSAELPHLYAFEDVAEALVVHELLARGVSRGAIRRAIDRLGEYGDWPLTAARLATAPSKRGARLLLRARGASWDIGERGWQQVVAPGDAEPVHGELPRGGWPARELPGLRRISVDPERLGGRPTVRGRRIAAHDVTELAAQPGGLRALRDGYGLSDTQIADARAWSELARGAAGT